jgi:hypothetical protein
MESNLIQDMLSMKLETIDNLETHNFYKNYEGLNYLIDANNKIN